MNVLITGSGGPLGVNLTRSLLASELPLTLYGTEANPYHVYLSLTRETRLIPHSRDRDAYFGALGDLVKEFGIDLIIPSHPVEVRAMSEDRERLAPARVFLPPPEVVARGQNKWESYRTWKEQGIPVPQTMLIKDAGDVDKAFDEIESDKLWVRGAGVPGSGIGVASLPVTEPDHMRMWVEFWKGYGGMIASEFLPGRNLTWLSVWKDGELIASQSRERLEYVIPHVSPSGITGAPAVSRTLQSPQLTELGSRAVRAIMDRPHGAFFIDLKEKEHGDPRITEINAGRFGTTIHFYTEAGFNFPELLLKLALDLPPGIDIPQTDPLEEEIYWIRTIDCGPVLVHKKDGADAAVRML